MNRICLPLLLSLMSIGSIDSIAFCDVQSFDTVFNVGHLIHMTRCGEVWTYDPRLKADYNTTSGKWKQMGKKGKSFIRDYSWYTFARRKFGAKIAEKFGKYDNKYLRFAAFSFQEIECDEPNINIERDCSGSALNWTGLSVIVDNYTAVTFRYNKSFEIIENTNNPLAFPHIQDVKDVEYRHFFWPDVYELGASRYVRIRTHPLIHSVLYSNSQNRLYIVLLSQGKDDNKWYHCFTHINMRKMLFDEEEWPKRLQEKKECKTCKYKDFTVKQIFNNMWAPAKCISGSVVGMFEENEEVYVVGRILYQNREFEDQVYIVNKPENGSPLEFEAKYENVFVKGVRPPSTLRSHFGCPSGEVDPELSKSSLKDLNERKRKKRSPQKSGHTSDFSYKESIIEELKEDWLQLSVMSFAALILLSFIIRVSKNLYF